MLECIQQNHNRFAAFLDRDGVLNKDDGYIQNVSDLEIFDHVPECVRQLHEMGYLVIVISNQSGIARGIIEENDVEIMNSYLLSETGIDAIYYCPHYKEGIVKRYRMICNCRKPKTGLVDKACIDFGINRNRSFMVGDRLCDMQLGKNAGLRNYLVRSRYKEEWHEACALADRVVDDLRDVVKDRLSLYEKHEKGRE